MKLLLISNTKLKVTLSKDDLSKYRLRAEKIDYDNTETRRAFWQILDEAKHKTGFDAASDRIFIQIYPSKGGGCEMYVIKLSPQGEIKENDDEIKRHESLFAFADVESLISASKLIVSFGYSQNSRLYYGDDKKYYLKIYEKKNADKGYFIGDYPFLFEYGVKIEREEKEGYIREHAIMLEGKNAVNLLSKL